MNTFATTALLLLATLFASPAAEACKCLGQTFEEKFEQATHVNSVFILDYVTVKDGKIDTVLNPNFPVPDTDEDIYYKAYIENSYKGCDKEQEYVLLSTAGNHAACGVRLEIGVEYMVSSTPDETFANVQRVSSCGLVQALMFDVEAAISHAESHAEECSL